MQNSKQCTFENVSTTMHCVDSRKMYICRQLPGGRKLNLDCFLTYGPLLTHTLTFLLDTLPNTQSVQQYNKSFDLFLFYDCIPSSTVI